jgi:adenylate cyclase
MRHGGDFGGGAHSTEASPPEGDHDGHEGRGAHDRGGERMLGALLGAGHEPQHRAHQGARRPRRRGARGDVLPRDSEAASTTGGELLKTIGDAVMVRHSDSADAVALGLTAAHDVIAGHGFPAVRVGMQHGPAIARAGDWFGATVNLAARVAAVAAGGEVLLAEQCGKARASSEASTSRPVGSSESGT